MTSLMLPLTNQEVMDRLPFTDASMILSLRLSSLGQKIVRRILKEVKKNIKKHSAEATSDDMLQAYFWTFLCSNSTFEHALQLVQERHETKMENQRSRRKSAKVLYTGWLQHVYGSLLTLKIMKQNKQALPKSYECHTFIDLDSHLESHEDFWGTYVCDTVAKVRSYITAGRRLTVAALLQLGELIVAARDWYERSDPKGNSKFDTQFRSEKAKYETADMFLWKFSDVESVLNNIDQLDVVVEIYALSSKFPGIKFMDTSHDDLLRFWGKFRKELMEGSIYEEDFGSPSFTLSAKRIAVVRKDSQDRLLKATANTSQALGSDDEEGSFSTRQEEETSAETEDCESSNSSSTEPPLTPMDSVSTALGEVPVPITTQREETPTESDDSESGDGSGDESSTEVHQIPEFADSEAQPARPASPIAEGTPTKSPKKRKRDGKVNTSAKRQKTDRRRPLSNAKRRGTKAKSLGRHVRAGGPSTPEDKTFAGVKTLAAKFESNVNSN